MTRVWIACLAFGALGAGCGETQSNDSGPTESFLCGTDGNTYSIEEAERGNHEVVHRGRCEDPMGCDSPTDCFVGDECASGSDVDWCVPGATRCRCPGVFQPVCGGDGRNYINACEVACAGVEIRHQGYCEEPPGEGCVRAGCSDHLCVEECMDIASTCEWRQVYECYQRASCERQLNGQCGFTPTQELLACLERHGEGMCRIDPRWQDGFEAECESPQVPGILGVIAVTPGEMMRLGEWFGASYELLEPAVFEGAYPGEGLLLCDAEQTLLEGVALMTPIGEIEFHCRILPEATPGECYDDGDCPPGHYCERIGPRPADERAPDADEPPLGICMDLCALLDCAPGYVCELGACRPQHGLCSSDEDCPLGSICLEGILGSPMGEGLCEPCPCPDIYAPVCGVDARTYGNGCEARCARVPVAHEGECEDDCPVETHLRDFEGQCVPKCYGSEPCADEGRCNAAEVCRQDPACPGYWKRPWQRSSAGSQEAEQPGLAPHPLLFPSVRPRQRG